MILLFGVSLGFVAYTYLMYPAAIALFARRRRPPGVPSDFRLMPVAVIVPAYNEARFIARKVRSLLDSDYPTHLLRVVVVSDGSTDGTAEEARKVKDPRVCVLELGERSGKVLAINSALRHVTEPILIMTDAGEPFDRSAIRCLVENFADPAVGAVSGEVELIDFQTGFSRNLGWYWRYETAIRRAQGALSALVGVCGPIYAIRRECMRSIPVDTILDDIAIPFEVLRQGRRVVYDARAKAYESVTPDATLEFRRKRRTLAGNYQLMLRYPDLLVPFRSRVALHFLSHKVFRLLVPYALVALFVSSWFLPEPVRSLMLATQLVFYGLAAGALLLGRRARVPLFTLPYTFCMLNWAVLVAGLYYFSGLQSAKWEKVK